LQKEGIAMKSSIVAGAVVLCGCLLAGPYLYGEHPVGGSTPAAAKSPQTHPADKGWGKAASQAPDFTLQDQDGKPVTLSDYKGKIVVLEWFNGECPYVQRHYKSKTMQSLAGPYRDKGVVWLAINSTSTADRKVNKAWVEKYKLDYPILDDHTGKVGKLYGAKTTPHMFVIDRDGNVVYKGAIDDDPSGKKEHAANYVAEVLQNLTDGQSVALKETKPYGCSVKYPKE
jgi:peroxiredoxin